MKPTRDHEPSSSFRTRLGGGLAAFALGLAIQPVAASAQVKVRIPVDSKGVAVADSHRGERVATYGHGLAMAEVASGSDSFSFWVYQPGSGWTLPFGLGQSGGKSGEVAVDMDDTWVIRSFSTQIVVSRYTETALPDETVLAPLTSSTAVAVSHPYAAYGQPGTTFGEIFLFEHDGAQWNAVGSVQGPGDPSGYGAAGLAMEDDYLFVGAPYVGSGQTGRIYIYRRDPANQICSNLWCPIDPFFSAPGNEVDNGFGTAVSADGEWLAVGAPLEDESRLFPTIKFASDAGRVYLFRRNQAGGWPLSDSVRLVDFDDGDHFGASVDLWNRSLAVGAPKNDIQDEFPTIDMGSAHVFLYDGTDWVERSFLRRPVFVAEDELGTSVGIGLHGVQAGAPFSDQLGPDGGAVYIFQDVVCIFSDGFESGDPTSWTLSVP